MDTMPPQQPLRGIALTLCALLAFAAFDATAKYLSTRFPVPMLVWARYTLPCIVMAAWFLPREGRSFLTTRRLPLQLLRSLILLASTLFGMSALRTVPLAEASAIIFVAPLIVTLLAGPMLGERVPRIGWIAVCGGFCGVLLIARPGGSSWLVQPGGAAALGSILLAALCYALYQVFTRQLAATERSLTTLFYTALGGAGAMTIATPLFWSGPAPSPLHAVLIASLGAWGMLGHFLLIRAFNHAPASTLSPFLYVQLIWATLLGWAVFDHLPDAIASIGILLIAASGLLVVLAERQRMLAALRR